MMRALKLSAIVLAALLVLILALLAWIIATQSGSRFALARVQGFLPEGIELGQANGRLADQLQLQDVRVRMDGLDLSIAQLWLRWSPGELLDGHLQIAEIGAKGLRYRALPAEQPPEPDEPFTLPERLDLPVSVTLERLTVRDAELHLSAEAAEAEPVVVNEVLFAGVSYADARFQLETLEVDSPLASVQGRLEATAAGRYPLDAHLEWRVDPGAYAAINGSTDLGGDLTTLEVGQRLSSPYDSELSGTVRNLLAPGQPIAVDVSLLTGELQLSRIQDELPEATISVNASVEGPVDRLNLQADISGTDPQARRFVAELAALVEGESIIVRQLTLRQPGREGELSGQGQIALAEDVVADFTVQWQSLQWPLTGAPTLTTPRGSLTLNGPLSDYRLMLDTRLEPAGAPPVELNLSGEGSLQDLAATLSAQVGESGTVEGRVNAIWDPALQGEAELSASGLDPSVLAPDWPGSVDLALTAAVGTTAGGNLQITLSRLDAGGSVRGQALSVAARGRFLQSEPQATVEVEDLQASLGATRIGMQGSLAERADFRWELASEDLSTLLPGAQGRLSGSGSLQGRLPQVSLDAALAASNLAYEGNSLESLDLDADVDLTGETDSQLALTARQAILQGNGVDQLTLRGTGRPGEHQFSLDLDAEQGSARLALNGRVEDPRGENPTWHYTLSEGELAYGDLAPWHLARAAQGSIGAGRVQVGQQCWRSSDAEICLQAQQDTQGLAADVNLDNLRFEYFDAFLPEGMALEGAVNASAALSLPSDGVLTAQGDVDTTAGQLTLPSEVPDASEPRVLRLEPSRIRLELNESQASAQAELNLEYGSLRLDVATSAALAAGAEARRPLADQSLGGNIRIEVPTLAFVSDFVPAVEGIEGGIDGDLSLGGTIGMPTLGGSLMVNNGAFTVPATGITLANLTLALRGEGREVAMQASAESGGGNLNLEGRLSLPGAAPTGTLAIRGSDFQVLNNDDGQVFLSPDLSVESGAERITISGEVHVPQAMITPGTQSPSAVTVSEDQVLESDAAETGETATQRELFAEVRLTLGEAVSFDGFGLTANFEGDLLVNQEPRTPTIATGEMRIIDGEYQAYGQGLVIDSGRIYFAGGPITQPALDIRAVRRPAEDILVGALVQGSLEQPSFELFSEPAMTQQEQLSWLVLGRSLEETPDGQESALSRAALAMGLKGGDFLAKNIGEQLGVDQIGIETGSGEAGAASDPGQASLVVGKYLSPKLYVSYGIGLFSPESVLEMQYEISRRWTLVTQSSGEATGADVLYTVERGGG